MSPLSQQTDLQLARHMSEPNLCTKSESPRSDVSFGRSLVVPAGRMLTEGCNTVDSTERHAALLDNTESPRAGYEDTIPIAGLNSTDGKVDNNDGQLLIKVEPRGDVNNDKNNITPSNASSCRDVESNARILQEPERSTLMPSPEDTIIPRSTDHSSSLKPLEQLTMGLKESVPTSGAQTNNVRGVSDSAMAGLSEAHSDIRHFTSKDPELVKHDGQTKESQKFAFPEKLPERGVPVWVDQEPVTSPRLEEGPKLRLPEAMQPLEVSGRLSEKSGLFSPHCSAPQNLPKSDSSPDQSSHASKLAIGFEGILNTEGLSQISSKKDSTNSKQPVSKVLSPDPALKSVQVQTSSIGQPQSGPLASQQSLGIESDSDPLQAGDKKPEDMVINKYLEAVHQVSAKPSR